MTETKLNTFQDIENDTLRTWNQCAVFFNTMSTGGKEAAQKYVDQLDRVSKKRMYAMFQYINVKGYEETKKQVNKGELALEWKH